MSEVRDFIKYPIRLLLSKKVAKIKTELRVINSVLYNTEPKHRRSGMSTYSASYFYSLIYLKTKYEAYINKWGINNI